MTAYPPGWRAGQGATLLVPPDSLSACPAPGNGPSIVGVGNRVVKAWALFLYGVSVGTAIAGGLAVLVFDNTTDVPWFAIGAAAALATGLIVHQRAKRLEKGRRWRRTRS